MDGAVVSKFLGQVIPLAAASHSEDNAIEHLPWINSFAARGLGRVHLQNCGQDLFPEAVRHLPDSIQSFAVPHQAPPHTFGEIII